jgi:hypothetical protein
MQLVISPCQIKGVTLKDGAKIGSIGKPSRYYNIIESAYHDFVHSYLSRIAQGKPTIIVNSTILSDKSREFNVEAGRVLETNNFNGANFTQAAIDVLRNNLVDQVYDYNQRVKEILLEDYNKVLSTNFKTLDEIDEFLKKNNIDKYSLGRLFQNNGLNLILDFHYVESKGSVSIKPAIKELVKKTKKQISNELNETMISDAKRYSEDGLKIDETAAFRVHQLRDGDVDDLAKFANTDVKRSDRLKRYLKRIKPDNEYNDLPNEYNLIVGNEVNPVYQQYWYETTAIKLYHRNLVSGHHAFYKAQGNGETFDSKAFIEQSKRGASEASTRQLYDTNNPYGIDKSIQVAIVDDPNLSLTFLTKKTVESRNDGASFSSEILMLQQVNSLGGDYGPSTGTHQKNIGTHYDDVGTKTFMKHNDFAITTEIMRKSRYNNYDWYEIHKKMLSNNPVPIQVDKLDIDYTILTYQNGEIVPITLEKRVYNNLFDLWTNAGDINSVIEDNNGDILVNGKRYRYTTMKDGLFHSSNIVADILGKLRVISDELNTSGKHLMKLSMASAIKSGQINVNPVDVLTDNRPFLTFDFKTNLYGLQLDASKETDGKEASLPTQIIGALGLSNYTQDITQKAFNILANMVGRDLDKRLADTVSEEGRNNIKEFMRDLSLSKLDTSSITSLAQALLQLPNVPYSNEQVSNIITATLNAYLTSEGIRENISGNQYVLRPPIQVFENEYGQVVFGNERSTSIIDKELSRQSLKRNTRYTFTLPDGTKEDFSFEAFYQLDDYIKEKKPIAVVQDLSKPRELRTAMSIFQDDEGNFYDIYDIPEIQNLIKTGEVTDEITRKIDTLIQEFVAKYPNRIDEPGEIIAPKSWKSLFDLSQNQNINDITIEYFLSQLNNIESKLYRQYKNYLKEVPDTTKEEYAQLVMDSFNKSLTGVTTRIPLQSLASVMTQKVVGFLDTEENTAIVNHYHQILTGGDFDVDKTTFMTYRVDSKTSLVFEDELINQLFNTIKEAASNPKNYLVRESGVNMDDIAELADQVKEILNPYSQYDHHKLRYANLVGKDVIGVAAVGIKTRAALLTAVSNDALLQNNKKMLVFNGKKYEEVDTPPIGNFGDWSNEPNVINLLGQLLNAGTDNAKYLYLDKLKIDKDNAGIVSTYIIMGLGIKPAIDIIKSPLYQHYYKMSKSSVFNGNQAMSMTSLINADLRAKPKPSNEEDLKNLKKILTQAQELTTLGKALGINQGIAPSEYGLFNWVSNINTFVNQQLSKNTESKQDNFDFLKWLTDENYNDEITKTLDGYSELFNILRVFNNNPQTISQFKILAKSYQIKQTIDPIFNQLNEIIPFMEENKLKRPGILSEKDFNAMMKGLKAIVRDSYLNTLSVNIEIEDKKFSDLSNGETRKDFIKTVNDYIIKLKSVYPTNQFLQRLRLDTTRSDGYGNKDYVLGLTQLGDVVDRSDYELLDELVLKQELRNLIKETRDPNLIKALRYYSLLVYNDSMNRRNFVKYLEDYTNMFTDFWDYEAQGINLMEQIDKDPDVLALYIGKYGYGEMKTQYVSDTDMTLNDDFDYYDEYMGYNDDFYGDDVEFKPYIPPTRVINFGSDSGGSIQYENGTIDAGDNYFENYLNSEKIAKVRNEIDINITDIDANSLFQMPLSIEQKRNASALNALLIDGQFSLREC